MAKCNMPDAIFREGRWQRLSGDELTYEELHELAVILAKECEELDEWRYSHDEIELACGGKIALEIRARVQKRRSAITNEVVAKQRGTMSEKQNKVELIAAGKSGSFVAGDEKVRLLDHEVEELAAYLLGLDDEYEDWEIERKLLCEFDMDLDAFRSLVERLLPLCDVGRSSMTGKTYRGFARHKNEKAKVWLLKMGEA